MDLHYRHLQHRDFLKKRLTDELSGFLWETSDFCKTFDADAGKLV